MISLGVRVVVTGGRNYADHAALFEVLDATQELLGIFALAHGGARGADRLADIWARANGIEPAVYEAEWSRYHKPGKKNPAGAIRNRKMLINFAPDVVIAFPGGTGTADCVRAARDFGFRVIDLRERLAA